MENSAQDHRIHALGHDARELARLSAQALMLEPFTRKFLREAGIGEGMRVLDTGCGAGDIFQEYDFVSVRSLPAAATFDRAVRWISEMLAASGADMAMGLKLYAMFKAAGLPAPTMRFDAAVADGEHPLAFLVAAETVRSLMPMMEKAGVAMAAEIRVESLAERMHAEVAAMGGIIVSPALVGARSRL